MSSGLNNTNTELAKMMDGIIKQKKEIQALIDAEEDEKRQIENQLRKCTDRMDMINKSLG